MTLRGVFVTGTGTDVGKTVVTAALLRALTRQGMRVLAFKPVQTGVLHSADGDCALYDAAVRDLPHALRGETGCVLRLPASPHLAARQEGRSVGAAAVAGMVRQRAAAHGCPVLAEGAGGVLVPLNERESTLDMVCATGLPVLVVMDNALGALNHALLTLDALRRRGVPLLGVVSTQTHAVASVPAATPDESAGIPDASRVIAADNTAFLRAQGVTVWELPCLPELADAPRTAPLTAWDAAADALAPLAVACRVLWEGGGSPSDTPAPAAPARTACDDAGFPTAAACDDSAGLLAWDNAHLWHPYTSATHPLPALEVTGTHGTRIRLRDGRELVDGMSSWWCAVHGYGHPALVGAVQAQAARMAHVMFGGLTHEPAVRAARQLLALMPHKQHLFWADSGSVAVEVALKMAVQYQQCVGQPARTTLLTPLGGYHGDTLGAMSVCDPVNGMHSLFRGVVAEQYFIPRPSCPFNGAADAPFDPSCLQPMEDAFARHGQDFAAAILEPVVQGAGGMWFYHPRYLRRLRELCDAYGVLLIFDEIATAFGRTGKLFAAQWAGVEADIVCVGKALTGGMMTLAATACTARVAQGICAGGNVFMHGPTFMGNALACAAASASLTLLEHGDWQTQVPRIEGELRRGLAPCIGADGVRGVRVLGAIGVVETEAPVPVAALQKFFVSKGVWIRPFAHLIYLMPPYVSSSGDIATLTRAVSGAVQQGVHLA